MGLPTLIIEQMWSKAADLLSTLPAGGGCFECDESCPAFLQRYICSHTIAAAESNVTLLSFLENYCFVMLRQLKIVEVLPITTLTFPRLTCLGPQLVIKAPQKKSIAQRKVITHE